MPEDSEPGWPYIKVLAAGNARAERARLRLRQTELAAALNLSQSATSALELGQREMSLTEAFIICRALNINLATLLRGVDEEVLRVFGLPSE